MQSVQVTSVTAQVSKFGLRAGKTTEALLPPEGPRRSIASMVLCLIPCAHQGVLSFSHSYSVSSVFLSFLIPDPAGGTQG